MKFNGDNLKIKDSEFIYVGRGMEAFGRLLSECLTQYCEALTKVCNEGVVSGAVHEGLEIYREYSEKLAIIAEQLCGKTARIVDSFLSEIEAADSYLYDAQYNEVRDFTQEQLEHLIDCLDDPWFELGDSFWDKVYGKILDFLDLSSKFDSAKSWLHGAHRLLLDYHDETKQGLIDMFTRVYNVDSAYAQSIPSYPCDYYTCHFANISMTLYCIRDMMDEMSYIISPQTGNFNVSEINERLGKAYAELVERFNTTINIVEDGAMPTIEQISDFASQPWADRYFHDFFDATNMYIADMGGYEAFKMVVYNMFDIFLKTVSTREEYNDYLRKKQLLDILDELSDSEYYSDSDEHESIEDAKVFLKYYEKYGSDIYEYLNTHRTEDGKLILDGRTVEAREFRDFLDSLGNAGDILKYSDQGAEYLSRLLADYSKGLKILDSFEKNYGDDPDMQKTIEEIRSLYEKEFGAWAEEAVNQISEVGIELAFEALKKASPIGVVIDTIDKTIDVFGEYTGEGAKAKNMYEALSYYDMTSSTEHAYLNALEAFRNADPGTDEYAVLSRELNNCFELHKKTYVKLFEAMANSSTGTKKSYYIYCQKQAESMSLNATTELHMMTYEQFLQLEN